MKETKFKKLLAEFKTVVIDVEFDETQYVEQEIQDYLITFSYNIWESELSKRYFTQVEDLEVFDTILDEEVELTEMQQLMLEEVAKSLVDLDYQEVIHPSTYAYNLGD